MSTPSDQTQTFNSGATTHHERRSLTSRLGAETYGIGGLAVQESARLPTITAVPQLLAMCSASKDDFGTNNTIIALDKDPHLFGPRGGEPAPAFDTPCRIVVASS